MQYDYLEKCKEEYSPMIDFNGDDATYWYDVFLTARYTIDRFGLCPQEPFCGGECSTCEDGVKKIKDYRNALNRCDLAEYVHNFKDLRKISKETTIPVPVLRKFLNGGELLRIWQTVLTKWIKGDSPVADIREAQFYRQHQLYTISDIDDLIYFLDNYPTGVALEAAGTEKAEIEAEMCGIVDNWTDAVYSHN